MCQNHFLPPKVLHRLLGEIGRKVLSAYVRNNLSAILPSVPLMLPRRQSNVLGEGKAMTVKEVCTAERDKVHRRMALIRAECRFKTFNAVIMCGIIGGNHEPHATTQT